MDVIEDRVVRLQVRKVVEFHKILVIIPGLISGRGNLYPRGKRAYKQHKKLFLSGLTRNKLRP